MIQDEDGTPCWSTEFPKDDGYYWCSMRPGQAIAGDFLIMVHKGKWLTLGSEEARGPEMIGGKNEAAFLGPVELPWHPEWREDGTLG